MQTSFTAEQLADPDTAEAAAILRTCVHCGFCTATCPTYVLLGDELDSPRGRIYLMKNFLESGEAATEDLVKHVDRCLSCLSCMTTCPSGVNYMHLVDHTRARIEETYRRPLTDRLLRRLLVFVLPKRGLFRWALRGAALVRPLIRLLPAQLRTLVAMAPSTLPRASQLDHGGVFPASGARLKRVALLTGCAQTVLAPSINDATVRLLTRHGCEVLVPQNSGCCGALTHHMGREEEALATARRQIDLWWQYVEDGGLDALVINTSGCGTTVKDYGFMLRHDPRYATKAATIARLARDVSEIMDELSLGKTVNPTGLSVAYHAACSMQHGQKIRREPKALLAAAGFQVMDIAEGHLCCGSAGTYNLLQPDIATQLRDRKIANIEATRPDLVATGNIGCITQIQSGTDLPVIHSVELLDWATGGPLPDRLRGIVKPQRHKASA